MSNLSFFNFIYKSRWMQRRHKASICEKGSRISYFSTVYVLVMNKFIYFIAVLRRFQHYFSYITVTVHLFMIPG